MANAEIIAYNVASFICALFVLEFGADKFVDHTAVVAERTGIPEAIIGLLTAGAEWEELAVVVACMIRDRPSLAIGNIVGSGISNILGAFSLEAPIAFDASAKAYTLILCLLTVLFSGLVQWGFSDQSRVFGVVLIISFAVYGASVAYLIAKGRLTAPESDNDSDSDSESESESEDEITHSDDNEETSSSSLANVNSATPLLEVQQGFPIARQHKHGTAYHVAFLVLGFLAIVLSSFVLSNAASTIADQTGLADVLFGVVFLSIATTLPEKFIAVVSGSRNRFGIMVANTVGSNIFLLSLCMGVLWVGTASTFDKGTVNATELGVLEGSTLFMTLTVWFGARWSRVAGVLMLLGYLAFLILEFTTIRHT